MNLEKTKVDWSFDEKVKEVGYWYYINNKIANIVKDGNEYKAVVDKYNVRLVYSTNRKEEIDDLECRCSYYENYDNFCPHVYALVCASFKVLRGPSNFNIDDLKKYAGLSKKKIKNRFVQKKIDIIDLDILGYNYEELFPDVNNDPLLDKLDKYIESMPLDILEKAKKETIEEDGDTYILDKAIKNKKAYQKKLEEENKLERKRMRKAMFKGFLDGLFGEIDNKQDSSNNELESWKKDYQPYQFEEEELEEDDYYYEDDEF